MFVQDLTLLLPPHLQDVYFIAWQTTLLEERGQKSYLGERKRCRVKMLQQNIARESHPYE